MKQWKGLMKKEWKTMKVSLYLVLILNVTAVFLIPFLLDEWAGIPRIEVSIVIGFVWLMFQTILAAILLLTSLEKDMKQPELWLHSTASIFKLTGAKYTLSFLITVISITWNGLLLIISVSVGSHQLGVSLGELIQIGIYFAGLSALSTIPYMVIAFFFWTIYQLLKPYLKTFASAVSFLLFLLLPAFLGLLQKFVNQLPRFGELPFPMPNNLAWAMESGGEASFYFESGDIYASDILLIIVLIALVYVGSTKWFEKKVRL
ncbi:hypothetical protein ACFOZY_15330 [Chungangia koreensis]|uniref:ABC-2 type transport system permease protein n=1 Tax=Chungangia koreensis TaxID=752657 RepID=A0ABV8X7I6_9LACT